MLENQRSLKGILEYDYLAQLHLASHTDVCMY